MTKDEVNKMSSLELHLYMTNKPARNCTKKKKVYGVGINDSKYSIRDHTSDGVNFSCPCYAVWADMLARCYAPGEVNQRKYQNIKVHDDWHLFSNFRQWWVDHYVENYYLDKDILYNPSKHKMHKIYGPDTCIYVPVWLNNFASNTHTGKYGRGVLKYNPGKKHRQKYGPPKIRYKISVTNPFTHKKINDGKLFETTDEAYIFYLNTTLRLIRTVIKPKLDEIHPDLYMGLVRNLMARPRFF